MASDDQPGLAALLDHTRKGDAVVVVTLHRLGHSLAGILHTTETLTAAGVQLRSLRESIDTTTPVGRFLAGVFASPSTNGP
ncbi:MAG: recombinase family protein [Pseudonocardiaceae bacterium]